MHLPTHLLTGWALANAMPLERRDRAIVTLAGIAPDIDGLGFVVEYTPLNQLIPLHWFSDYHHVLAHNLGFGLLITVIALMICRRRFFAPVMVFVSFHLHLLADIVGSRGPDGYQWPIPYLLPFSDKWQLTWQGQWALVSWQNISITILFLILTIWLAWKRGFSPLEIISQRADARVVETLRARFGMPKEC
jgi:inner membrane protein